MFGGLTDLFKDKQVDKSVFRVKPVCQCGSAGLTGILEEIVKTGVELECHKCHKRITVAHAMDLLDALKNGMSYRNGNSKYLFCKEKYKRIGYEVCMKNQEQKTCKGCRDYEKTK